MNGVARGRSRCIDDLEVRESDKRDHVDSAGSAGRDRREKRRASIGHAPLQYNPEVLLITLLASTALAL
jgi:hypothetical protein